MGGSRDPADFDKELHTLYETKLPISASKIQQLTRLALKHARNYKHVVHSIEKFLSKCSADLKLAGLYVIDSIARAAQKAAIGEGGGSLEAFAYLPRLEEKIEAMFPYLLTASEKDKEKMKKVVSLWKKMELFNTDMLEALESAYFSSDSTINSPVTKAKSTTSSSSSRRDPRNKGPERSTTPPGSPPPLASAASAATAAPTIDPVALLASLASLGGGLLAPLIPTLASQLQPLFGGAGDMALAQSQFQILLSVHGMLTGQVPQDPTTLATLLSILGGSAGGVTPGAATGASPANGGSLGQGIVIKEKEVEADVPAGLNFDYSDDEEDGTKKSKPKPVSSTISSQPQSTLPPSTPTPTFASPLAAPLATPNFPQHSPPPQSKNESREEQPGRRDSRDDHKSSFSPKHEDHDEPQQRQQPPPFTMRGHGIPRGGFGGPMRGRGGIPGGFAVGMGRFPPPQNEKERDGPQCMPPMKDPEVPMECMKILSRTLYVGGVSVNVSKELIREVFETEGRVETVMINYPKFNAFIKLMTREEADKARLALNRTVHNGATFKVGWGCGFGPKDIFDYSNGYTILPINRMSESDRRWISAGIRGGGPIEGGTVVEEPNVGSFPARDTEYGKDQMPPVDENASGPNSGGMGRGWVRPAMRGAGVPKWRGRGGGQFGYGQPYGNEGGPQGGPGGMPIQTFMEGTEDDREYGGYGMGRGRGRGGGAPYWGRGGGMGGSGSGSDWPPQYGYYAMENPGPRMEPGYPAESPPERRPSHTGSFDSVGGSGGFMHPSRLAQIPAMPPPPPPPEDNQELNDDDYDALLLGASHEDRKSVGSDDEDFPRRDAEVVRKKSEGDFPRIQRSQHSYAHSSSPANHRDGRDDYHLAQSKQMVREPEDYYGYDTKERGGSARGSFERGRSRSGDFEELGWRGSGDPGRFGSGTGAAYRPPEHQSEFDRYEKSRGRSLSKSPSRSPRRRSRSPSRSRSRSRSHSRSRSRSRSWSRSRSPPRKRVSSGGTPRDSRPGSSRSERDRWEDRGGRSRDVSRERPRNDFDERRFGKRDGRDISPPVIVERKKPRWEDDY
ncbi:hypothetical protein HDU97_005132 [Phlyctochytrium planicorne]|nr:hypothetical protein HDU97_005132 [Phlyctochytrium planicorne]